MQRTDAASGERMLKIRSGISSSGLSSCASIRSSPPSSTTVVREQHITGKDIHSVTLRITGIIHRLLSVVEKGDVFPIELQIQMHQFVNDG